MQNKTVNHIISIEIILGLVLFLGSFKTEAQEDYFVPTVKGSSVIFSPAPEVARDSGVQLIILGPQDYRYENLFSSGEVLFFDAKNEGLSNGQYNYELTYFRNMRLINNRQFTPLDLEGKTNEPLRKSGTLSLVSGRWANTNAEENNSRDFAITDDLIVEGSACFGQDCVINESFGYNTIRLKENNLRIGFVDTSNSASFPSTDWELRANDIVNGGANKFSIADLDNQNEIFSVEGGAPANSLFVDDRGRVGFGTAAPLLDQHILSGNTPATRFEQDGSGGYPSQTWDIGGNETEFFIRDTTNAQVPVRVLPGAPSDSLVVNSSGDIEIGGSIVTTRSISARSKVLESYGKEPLEDLAKVEDYINKYKQLPGIDTSSQDLVQLQLLLLEKIQELTLYTIEQDKRIKSLEAQLEK